MGNEVISRTRTFLTLAELIRPFLAMFSMSSILVEPLHLQAMIVEASRCVV